MNSGSWFCAILVARRCARDRACVDKLLRLSCLFLLLDYSDTVIASFGAWHGLQCLQDMFIHSLTVLWLEKREPYCALIRPQLW